MKNGGVQMGRGEWQKIIILGRVYPKEKYWKKGDGGREEKTGPLQTHMTK